MSLLEAELMGVLAHLDDRHIVANWDGRTRSADAGEAMRLTVNIGGEHVPVYLADPRWRLAWPEHWQQVSTAMQQAQLWQLRGKRIRRALESAFGAGIAVSRANIEAVPDGWMKLRVRCGSLDLNCWCEAESLVRALPGTRRTPDTTPRAKSVRALGRLKTRCRMMLRPISVPMDSYLALTPGDVLLLDVADDFTLQGTLCPTGFDAGCAVRFDRKGMVMVDGNFVVADDAGALSIVEAKTVSLNVELGTCEMSLSALADLKPGECVRLDRAFDDLSVSVMYQGQRVATGQLTDIAGLVGIRLDSVYLSERP
ncbi:FliM/FliN family flagellar motor C-terminal domain-containing protein [Pandoraea sp. NPDC087047]|uniref:FliM/FliN family flagellar motor switch protein n=1 Tax=Pandoraea sp. NPDC087047 TaxID=3364390 RepID=UPI0037F39C7F